MHPRLQVQRASQSGNHRGQPHAKLKILGGTERDVRTPDVWLLFQRSAGSSREYKSRAKPHKSRSPDSRDKRIRTHCSQQRNLQRTHPRQAHHWHGFSVVGQRQPRAPARSPPQALLPKTQLPIREVQCRVGFNGTKSICSSKHRSRARWQTIYRLNRLLRRSVVGGNRRRILILSAHVESHWPRLRTHRNSGNSVTPFTVRAAVIISYRLSKVKRIAKRSAGNSGETSVNAFYLGARVLSAVHQISFARKFFIQSPQQWRCHWIVFFIFLVRFRQFAPAFKPGPGTQCRRTRIDKTHGRQPIESTIDPAIKRDIARAHLAGRTFFLAKGVLLELAPLANVDIRIAGARAINLPTNVPADCAADYRIAQKVIVPFNARRAHAASKSVTQNLCHRPGIFMGDDAGHCPTHGSMLRRKRTSAIEEITSPICREGAIATCDVFDEGSVQIGIDCGFPAQKAGLAHMVILCDLTPQIHSTAHSGQRRHPVVRERRGARHRGRSSRHVSLDRRVRGDQSNRNYGQWNRKLPLPFARVKWRLEQSSLILQYIARERLNTDAAIILVIRLYWQWSCARV